MKISTSRIQPFFDIEFDQDLPLFPEPIRPKYSGRDGYLFSRAQDLDAYATQLVAENAGCIPFELAGDPQQAYREFLTDLVVIPGLIGIISANRYSFKIQAGRHFEASRIASLVADVVRRHFYPGGEPQFVVTGISGQVEAQT